MLQKLMRIEDTASSFLAPRSAGAMQTEESKTKTTGFCVSRYIDRKTEFHEDIRSL